MDVKTPIIAGNWKMHMGPAETTEYLARFDTVYPVRTDRSVWFFPPAVSLTAARDALRDRSDIELGVQNVHWEHAGAFTGETSPAMALAAGARIALIGHSERRHVFGETEADTGRKLGAALGAGLVPLLCVGETLEQRRAGNLELVLTRQLDAALASVAGDVIGTIVIAYEPVWAIGTGVNATPEDATAAHRFIRTHLSALAHAQASGVPILYGGSVNPDNARQLLSATDVDGLLVGGASLKPEAFARIALTSPD